MQITDFSRRCIPYVDTRPVMNKLKHYSYVSLNLMSSYCRQNSGNVLTIVLLDLICSLIDDNHISVAVSLCLAGTVMLVLFHFFIFFLVGFKYFNVNTGNHSGNHLQDITQWNMVGLRSFIRGHLSV